MIFSNKLEGIYHCKFLCKFKLHRLRNKRNGAAAEAKGRKNKKLIASWRLNQETGNSTPSALPRDSLPPSSVMTTTVVAGPSPSGLNTCTETRYCVKICSRWIVYFSVV